ncbi:MAG: porin family protein [Candidatus Cloacimonadaceae bacterium]|nr:PorT family protein [Candidatus Cloacimonadota bacterium]MDX9950004.1 porin family protein [Candidatus Syntrophosphaera sp.]
MKKTLIIIALTVLSLSLAFADVTYGLRGGLNLTNRSSSSEYSAKVDNRAGFHGGLVLQYGTDMNFMVQPEILYTQKGYKYTLLSDHTVGMDYVEVPVLLKYNIHVAKGLQLQPTVAPYVGYAVIAKDKSKNTDLDLMDRINKIDYGVDLGVDVQLLNQVLVGARYKIGLADYDSSSSSVKYNHNGLIFSLGFLF